MPWKNLSHNLLLPELELLGFTPTSRAWSQYLTEKRSKFEVCPKCATPSSSIYDRRTVMVKDAPIRGQMIYMKIIKRRFMCKPCGKPFTEPVPGIKKGRRSTERFRRSVLWACENFVDLKRVEIAYRISPGYVFKILYEQLELNLRKRQYPWPKTIGVDEHSFKRGKNGYRTEFTSVIIDYNNKRMFEVVDGKTKTDLYSALHHIEGRENVQNAVIDMCDPFKSFIKEHFPNAKIVADKFHVLRLLTPALIKKRYEIVGSRADARARRLLLCSSKKLECFERKAIWRYLENHSELKELYSWKERMHGFYRIKGFNRAAIALRKMCDEMSKSTLPAIKTLRRTLMRWRVEILNYFTTRLTNGRTEGFNNLAKLVQSNSSKCHVLNDAVILT